MEALTSAYVAAPAAVGAVVATVVDDAVPSASLSDAVAAVAAVARGTPAPAVVGLPPDGAESEGRAQSCYKSFWKQIAIQILQKDE